MEKLKRYNAYFGCSTSIEQIAEEDKEGKWVKYEDLCEFIFGEEWEGIKEILEAMQ